MSQVVDLVRGDAGHRFGHRGRVADPGAGPKAAQRDQQVILALTGHARHLLAAFARAAMAAQAMQSLGQRAAARQALRVGRRGIRRRCGGGR
jgi:hypothetical protein